MSLPQDIAIGVGQGADSTAADQFEDSVSTFCSLDCGAVDYKLVYANGGAPVSDELATLLISQSQALEVTAKTDDFFLHGTHEVKIQGTSQFTTIP